MDVDADVFDSAAAQCEEFLSRASFVALDLEMTGIFVDGVAPSAGDVLHERYAKCKAVVETYTLMQVGVSCFETTPPATPDATPSVTCRTFNFYVFPKAVDELRYRPRVSLCSGTSAFHKGNGMDFQRWITKGVPYVDAVTAARLRQLYKPVEAVPSEAPKTGTPSKKRKLNEDGDAPATPEASAPVVIELHKEQDKKWMEEAMGEVMPWLDACEPLVDGARPDGVEEGPPRRLKLKRGNGFLIAALRSRVEAHRYPQLRHVFIESEQYGSQPWEKDRWLVDCTDAQRGEIQDRQNAEKQAKLQALLGFQRIWEALKGCGKPLVFHNGFYDFLFLTHWLERPLPGSFSEFESLAKGLFSGPLFDTKLFAERTSSALMRNSSVKFTSLEELAKGLAEHVRLDIIYPEPFDKYTVQEGRYHEAGFDAMLTGRLFLYFTTPSLLGVDADDGSAATRPLVDLTFPATAREFTNRVHINRGMLCFAVDGAAHPLCIAGHYRGVSDFPDGFREHHIRQEFAPFLEAQELTPKAMQCRWINKSSLVVGFIRAEDNPPDLETERATPTRATFADALDAFLKTLTKMKWKALANATADEAADAAETLSPPAKKAKVV